jgi:hypothetical protein
MPDFGSLAWYEQQEISLGPDAEAINPSRVLRLSPNAEEIDFCAERPLASRTNSELVDLARNGLERSWPAIELPTLAYQEALHRRPRVLQLIETAFQANGVAPIGWLDDARSVLRSTDLRPGPSAALSAVYYVLVDGFTTKNGNYGVYVGSTSTNERISDSRQAARIAQHFSGVRAASSVRSRGIEPLWSLNCFTEHVRAVDRRDVEDIAHFALEDAVPRVLGDVQQ